MSPHVSHAMGGPVQLYHRVPEAYEFEAKNSRVCLEEPTGEGFSCDDWPDDDPAADLFDLIRDIKDPEYPYTLSQLNVVSRGQISVQDRPGEPRHIQILFTPTVPHCHLAALIGLCIRTQLTRCLAYPFKLDIRVAEGAHDTEEDGVWRGHAWDTLRIYFLAIDLILDAMNKQINDKERTCAAMENPELRAIVDECLKDMDD